MDDFQVCLCINALTLVASPEGGSIGSPYRPYRGRKKNSQSEAHRNTAR